MVVKFEAHGCPDHVLSTKIKILKGKLKEWSKTKFSELLNRKNSLLNELAELDHSQDNRELNEDEMMIRQLF